MILRHPTALFTEAATFSISPRKKKKKKMSTGTQGVIQSNDMARNLVEAVFRGIFHYSKRLTTGQASRLPSFISGVDRNAPRLLQICDDEAIASIA